LNWAAALYTAGIWTLAASIWNTTYRLARPNSPARLPLTMTFDLLPGLVLAVVVAYFA
jgi:hypothetical protein